MCVPGLSENCSFQDSTSENAEKTQEETSEKKSITVQDIRDLKKLGIDVSFLDPPKKGTSKSKYCSMSLFVLGI